MWALVQKYGCYVKVFFWLNTVLLPLGTLGLIIIQIGCGSKGYNSMYCLQSGPGELAAMWISHVLNCLSYI